jgi:nitroimidazol reductase NimA-like FMN-containing flavoprotein (pyridoxamine 5'-phosphate oxidase superfamily)
MAIGIPIGELAPQFSSPDATPTSWADARKHVEEAEVYWLSTVRPDGRPHVAPLIAVRLDGALHFRTGPDERKARNLAGNARVALTTGCNSLGEGLDLVVEGDAVQVRNEATLHRLADEYVANYGEDWRFTVLDAAFLNPEGGQALVYEVRPKTAFGFGKGEPFSQTRWRF